MLRSVTVLPAHLRLTLLSIACVRRKARALSSSLVASFQCRRLGASSSLLWYQALRLRRSAKPRCYVDICLMRATASM